MAHTKECLVYPGEYNLLPETEALMKDVNISGHSLDARTLVNMEELDDCFEIEMIVPGAKRENLFIQIKDNILSVIVLHKHFDQQKKWQIHEYDANCIERHILLPAHADHEFISAAYRPGILS
ncbi:MAG TPA: Hsp20/alpha crystallin family protein, partial [Agriterribacter sp.]|nr:Hsp20/alpha crystallin family protein [Agriterribacter sp.]